MGRVFILALDGLEAYFVEEWNLQNLMQKTHGRIDIPKPATPIVWTSFITGEQPRVHGVRRWWTYGKSLDWMGKKPPLSWIKGKKKMALKMGISPRPVAANKNLKTIFDLVKPSIALFIPAYSEDILRKNLWLLDKTKELDKFLNKIWETHKLRRKEMYERLKDDWKLFMAWFDLADWIGHICYGRRFDEFREAYTVLDNLALEIKQALPKDIILIIVSDHGMTDSGDGVTGDHSRHSFWSLNMETDWRPTDVTDFCPKILEWGEK